MWALKWKWWVKDTYLAARNSNNNNNLTNHKSCAANAVMDQEHSSHLVPEEKAEPDTTDLIALHFSKGNQAYAGGIPTLPSLPSYWWWYCGCCAAVLLLLDIMKILQAIWRLGVGAVELRLRWSSCFLFEHWIFGGCTFHLMILSSPSAKIFSICELSSCVGYKIESAWALSVLNPTYLPPHLSETIAE